MQEMMRSKIHAMLLSVFPLFKFGSDAPLIHIDFIKSWAVASIHRFFICMWCAATKHCLANNVLGISSCIQLLFPPADAASMLFIGDTVISGISVALALCIAVPRESKNCFFSYAFLQYTVSLTVIIIIINWFQSGQAGGQHALQYAASGVIGFVAVHCLWNRDLWNGEVKQWHIHGGEDDATFASEGCNDEVDSANEDEDADGGEDEDEDADGGEDGDGGEDDATFASEDCDDEVDSCARVVQLLAIRANFRISAIIAYDWYQSRSIYTALEGEVQEEGMDLVLTGPYRMLEAYGALGLKVFPADDEESPIYGGWDVTEPEEFEEFVGTIYGGLGRKLEVTYLVIPEAIETHVEVRLNLIDLGSRSRAVYGSVKARAIDYGSKNVHLFSRERGRSLSLPCGSTCILPLRPYMIALRDWQHFKLQIEVDLKVITSCDNQEEDKNFKFCLDCSRRIRSEERLEPPFRIRSQKREFNGDQVEVSVMWHLERS